MRLGVRKIIAVIGIMGGALITLAAPSSAATITGHANTSAERAVVEKVFHSSDPAAAVAKLTPSQRALVQDWMNHMQATTVVSKTGTLGPNSPDVKAMGPSAVQAASSALTTTSGCWYHYQYATWSDLGVTEGHTWMQLDWCGSGGQITSHYIALAGGGSLSGVKYDGIVSEPGLNVGWEYRQAVEFEFNIGPVYSNPCMQIRGGATGLYSYRSSCNLS